MFENILDLEILDKVYFGNDIRTWLTVFLIFLGLMIILWIIQIIILSKLEKLAKRTETDADDLFIKLFKNIKPPFFIFICLYIALQYLNVTSLMGQIIDGLFILYVVYEFNSIANKVIVHVATKDTSDVADKHTAKVIAQIVSALLWVIGILLILSNVGVNISSLLTGLGIGGVAVALALQNILSDLFSSFSIYFDKPFKPGDFIVVGDEMGTVRNIGIKSTRIKSLSGEEVVISNKELTTARIHNYKKMTRRRVELNVGVTYSTKSETLKKIPKMIEEIVTKVKDVEFSRAHFKIFNDSSLGFEIIYYVLDSNYRKYMDVNEEIHLAIKEKFDKEKVSFAFPTQTVHVKK